MATTWTSEPPTVAGYYWWRTNANSLLLRICRIRRLLRGRKRRLFVEVNEGDFERLDDIGGEWWPVAIEPPGGAT